jgi:hypothetical protein
MNIYEVIELGQIVYANEEYGVIITANGSYLNWFNGYDGKYENTDCRSTAGKPYYEMTMAELEAKAKQWFEENEGVDV